MNTYIDTFDDFVQYWSRACSETQEQKLQLWETVYMRKHPDLLEKQTRQYEEAGFHWQTIASERVFSRLGGLLPSMKKARDNLPHVCRSIYEQAVQALDFDSSVVFVIYVGIGCGAGWATYYQGLPACLLGLEKIAELGWHSEEQLSELVSHEIGHLAHMTWRDESEEFERHETDPLFLLYSEGFAKRCEHIILERESWSQADSENWLPWCRTHIQWLAKEYLERADNGKPVNDFFGDWLNVQGRSQTGYYLGWTCIVWLEETFSLREMASLPFERVRSETRSYLCDLAAHSD